MDTAGVIQTNLYSAGTLNIDSSGSFGNPKIVLNASNGNGTFAGGVGGDYVFINRNTTAANLLQASFGYNNTTTTLVKGTGIFLGTSLGNANGAVPDGTNLRLLTDGNGTFAGTVTESGSDRKFKENIVDAPAQLTDVSALQLRTWDWNDLTPGNEERNNRRSMGLVAQEAELIDSNLVYDVNEGEDTYKAVDYKVLTMKLLGAVKELAAKNETLEQRLSDAGIA